MLALLLCAVPQTLDQDPLPAWRDHIAPTAVESRWEEIGWRASVEAGRREAAEEGHAIGFLLRLAPADWRVAPTFVNVYDADWVVQAPSAAK